MADQVNPHLQVRPNYRGDPALQAIIAQLANEERTADQVIQDLEQEWDQRHNEAVALWDAAHPGDQGNQQPNPLPPAGGPNQPPAAPPPDPPLEDEPNPHPGEDDSVGSQTRKSSPAPATDEEDGGLSVKIGKMVVGKSKGKMLMFEPSPKALKDLRNLHFVYLHHFLDTKRKEAFENRASGIGRSFTLSADGSSFTAAPDDTAAYSKSVLRDDQLTWDDFVAAQKPLLMSMHRCKYPLSVTTSLAEFFGYLNGSDIQREPSGRKAIQLYEALHRQQWHEEMQKKEFFDIRIVDDADIEKIRTRLEDDARNAKSVLFVPPASATRLTSSCFLSPSLTHIHPLRSTWDAFNHALRL
ncbi:hypothetical protein BC835DRAFT_1412091 [Cytidiella melzeri]|nr:hypothetical protein BC835DRAFT_1412091 [Cytidiella melzeri]